MIIKGAAARAHFDGSKMGKCDLARGEQMFVGLNAFEPGQRHEPHTHCDRDKLYVVLEGQGRLMIGGDSADVSGGDVALAPAGVEHSLENRGDGRLVALVAMAPPPPASRS